MTPRRRRAAERNDAGETLIEILITVVIMGITVAALIGGLTLLITGTESHRRLADVEVVSRAYGEQIVDQAMHPAATTLSADVASGSDTVTVSSSSGFPGTGSKTVSIDGEVAQIKTVTGNVWKLTGNLSEAHAAGTDVVLYTSCPTAADLFVSGFAAPAASRLVSPSISDITNIEYFDNAGTPVSQSACGTYWQDTGMPCSKFDSPEHLTQCDPGLIRVTFQMKSTDAGTSTGAKTQTSVLIRRGNT